MNGAGQLYDGFNFAKSEQVIVVNFNYRLGPFGFLALPSLINEDPDHPGTGNYGIKDQRAAMQWVQNSIHCNVVEENSKNYCFHHEMILKESFHDENSNFSNFLIIAIYCSIWW